VGRDAELDALMRAVAKNRVVSMTGAPGVGKSALAAAFASARPAVLCALDGVDDADAVCREIARALGVPHAATASASSTAAHVGRAIAGRGKTVIVLDDADLARTALARLVPVWLRDAPAARFLVSARTRVGIAAAQRFELGALEVPSADERERAVIERSPAVALFVRCAIAVRSDYRLTGRSAQHVAAIVRTLDGLPLAIELCAPRVVALGEAEIAAMLAERLDALDGSSASRGRTLRGAFDLSWDQLDPADAHVLAACSVFRGSFDLDAAVAVTGEPRLRAADALERLDDASLLRAFEPRELPGARRHAMPASVRIFAADRLTAPGKTARRHAEHFGRTTAQGSVFRADVLALDRENLEAALAWATDLEQKPLAARVALALAPLALSRGPLVPFLERVDALLTQRGLPRAIVAELHLVRGLARIHHGRRDDALEDLEAARSLAARAGELRVEVLAASKTGLVIGMKGRFEEAREHFDAAASRLLPDARSDPWLRGTLSKDRANVLSEEGRNAEAMIELARARDLFHLAGDVREEGFVLMMLGSRLLDDGQLRDARRDCTGGLSLLRMAGDHRSAAWCEVLLSLVDAEDGDLLNARTRLDRALVAFRVIGDAHTEGLVLGYLGNVALEQGALVDAESSYRDARLRLAEVGDQGSEAMCTASAGVVDVALGRTASARDRFARAAELLLGDGRAARREAVAVLASILAPEGTARSGHGRSAEPEEVRFARRVVGQVRARLAPVGKKAARQSSDQVLVIAPDGSWVRTPAGRTAKFAKGALREIVRRLAQDRVRYPGRAIALGVLVRAGWPGESILPAAAKNRLHVTIARLRRAGLAGLLVHDDEGYVLDAAVPARFAEAGERP
jgi:predicted ATPase